MLEGQIENPSYENHENRSLNILVVEELFDFVERFPHWYRSVAHNRVRPGIDTRIQYWGVRSKRTILKIWWSIYDHPRDLVIYLTLVETYLEHFVSPSPYLLIVGHSPSNFLKSFIKVSFRSRNTIEKLNLREKRRKIIEFVFIINDEFWSRHYEKTKLFKVINKILILTNRKTFFTFSKLSIWCCWLQHKS